MHKKIKRFGRFLILLFAEIAFRIIWKIKVLKVVELCLLSSTLSLQDVHLDGKLYSKLDFKLLFKLDSMLNIMLNGKLDSKRRSDTNSGAYLTTAC